MNRLTSDFWLAFFLRRFKMAVAGIRQRAVKARLFGMGAGEN